MRPLLLTLRLHPLFRCFSIHARSAVLPALDYPSCGKNFVCSAPLQVDFRTAMADPSKGDVGLGEAAEPCESETAGEKESKPEAPKEQEQEEEARLPKLSAADFRVYNSM